MPPAAVAVAADLNLAVAGSVNEPSRTWSIPTITPRRFLKCLLQSRSPRQMAVRSREWRALGFWVLRRCGSVRTVREPQRVILVTLQLPYPWCFYPVVCSCRAPELPPSLVPFIVPSQFYETACAKISQFSFGSLIFRWRAIKQFESWILAMGETRRHPAVVNNWWVYKFLIWEMPWIVCRHVSFVLCITLLYNKWTTKKGENEKITNIDFIKKKWQKKGPPDVAKFFHPCFATGTLKREKLKVDHRLKNIKKIHKMHT